VQASGRTWVPLIGAAVGLTVAFGLCVVLYRTSVKLDLGKFFTRSAVVLVVIAAGVLSYGVGELQSAGLVPGHTWVAFDLSRVVSTDAWWVSIITGVTNLAPVMTWTQVILYVAFAVTVLVLYFRPQTVAAPARAKTASPRPMRRPWLYLAAAVILPLAAVAGFVLAAPSTGGGQAAAVTVSAGGCADDWAGASAWSAPRTRRWSGRSKGSGPAPAGRSRWTSRRAPTRGAASCRGSWISVRPRAR
jgi:high-affinity iron transporter